MGMILQTVYKLLVVSMLSLSFFITTYINCRFHESRIDFSSSSSSFPHLSDPVSVVSYPPNPVSVLVLSSLSFSSVRTIRGRGFYGDGHFQSMKSPVELNGLF